ncbi:MAG: glycosyltransferase family 39 protein [Phycisphaerae bacterium]|nr:glycosyltransferase family 39 protein [Phycisphaerae bacterium]
MKLSRFHHDSSAGPIGVGRTILDLAVITAVVAVMVALRAHAPSSTHRYAQAWQIRASLDHLQAGSLLLPRIDSPNPFNPQKRDFARKPQMYAWLTTAAMKLTGSRGGWVYRTPTILSAWGLAILVYLLGRRWYSRRAGLLAAVFWATIMQMNKLIYLATTDMLLAWWIVLAVFCADRVLYHPAGRRWCWLTAFWLAMLAAALTKGWGIVNLVVLGLFIALASAFGPGFAVLRKAAGVDKAVLFLRLLLRRCWTAGRRVKLGWGLLLLIAVSIPLWWGMLHIGGQAFRDKTYFEVVQRITGQGADAPHRASGPAPLHLYYNTLPASIFAGCAFFFVPFRRWLRHGSSIALPVCWIVAVVLAFTIPAGFRPDYLLPCYPAAALLAGWATVEFTRPERYDGKVGKHLRRICQATAAILTAGLVLIPAMYLLADVIPALGESLTIPAQTASGTWVILAILPAVGLAGLYVWVRSVRRKSFLPTAILACVGMIGVSFFYTHFWSRDARSGDGETMIRFAREIQPIVGRDDFAIYNAQKLCTEVHLGRFGQWLDAKPEDVVKYLRRRPVRWLITSDFGLVALGAYRSDPAGEVKFKNAQDGTSLRCHVAPRDLGALRVRSPQPIEFESWGRIYLIELTGSVTPTSEPYNPGYISDPVK